MKKSIDVANVLLTNNAEEALLLRRAQALVMPGLWGLPGGMVDPEEELEAAALRELTEETSITSDQVSISGNRNFLVETPENAIKIFELIATLLDDSVEIVLNPDEHTGYKWSAPDEIYASSDTLPCLPTMIAQSLSPGISINDTSIKSGTKITLL